MDVTTGGSGLFTSAVRDKTQAFLPLAESTGLDLPLSL